MHHAGNKAVKCELEKLLNSCPTMLANGPEAVLTQLQHELDVFFEQNTADGDRNSGRKKRSPKKIELQKALLGNIDTLANAWEHDAPVQDQDTEVGEDEDFFSDSRLVDLDRFKGVDDEDDEDYEE